MHVVIYSKDGISGNFKKGGIKKTKSQFANEVFQNEMLFLNEQKTAYREQIKVASEESISRIVDNINNNVYENPDINNLMYELS